MLPLLKRHEVQVLTLLWHKSLEDAAAVGRAAGRKYAMILYLPCALLIVAAVAFVI
jgi:uncharacterized protein (DUF2062 family)